MSHDDTFSHRLTKLESQMESRGQRLIRLETTMNATADDVDKTEADVIAIQTRLENGRKAFDTLDGRLHQLEERTRPQVPSPLKIVAVTLAVFTTLSSALWLLSKEFADRPTVQQIEKIMQKHDGGGHGELRKNVRAIQSEQQQQSHIVKTIKKTQKAHGAKLEQVLERLPPKRRRRRRR